jgi:transposase
MQHEEDTMQILYPRCCGLDIHKAFITACVLIAEGKAKKRHQLRCGTMTRDLLALADWLAELGVTHVGMESTGVYWKPIWNVLEGRFELLLINAQHFKSVPGRKTDMRDCEWLAELLQHGLLRSSFVPPRPVRDLRDLNRNRAILAQQRAAVSNRIEKVLENANIKLGTVASHVLGQSGRAMLKAISTGEEDVDKLAEMAKAKLRKKIPMLRAALTGALRDHHRFLLHQWLTQLENLEKQIAELDQEIERQSQPFQEVIERLTTIPGVDHITACALVAEIGTNMAQFPSAENLTSWGGLCPGNNESGGKRFSGKTRKGNPWLRRVLCQAAWAASHTRNTYLSAQYHRLAAKRNKNRAIIAVAHSILVIVYFMIKTGEVYRESRGDYFERINAEGLKRHLIQRLERLGHRVVLEPIPNRA